MRRIISNGTNKGWPKRATLPLHKSNIKLGKLTKWKSQTKSNAVINYLIN